MNTHRIVRCLVLSFAVSVVSASWAQSPEQPTPTTPPPTTTPPTTGTETEPMGRKEDVGKNTAAANLDDGQLARVLGLAHMYEMDEANLVLGKTTNPGVRDFAQQMLRDHKRLDGDVISALQKGGIEGKDSELSKQMLRDARRFQEQLQMAEGQSLDRMYIDHQVDEHENLLQILDSVGTNLKSQEMKGLIQKHRADVQTHLDRARELQTETEKGVGAIEGRPEGTRPVGTERPMPDEGAQPVPEETTPVPDDMGDDTNQHP